MKSKIPLSIFKDHLKYELVKLDEFDKPIYSWLGYYPIWVLFNDKEYVGHNKVSNPSVGYCLCLDYDGRSFKWQTSEILNWSKNGNEIIFNTKNSKYKLIEHED